MKKRKTLYISSLTLVLCMSGCGTSPGKLADESKRLHEELSRATTKSDSTAIFKEIAAVESHARAVFTKAELKEYERLAHPAQ